MEWKQEVFLNVAQRLFSGRWLFRPHMSQAEAARSPGRPELGPERAHRRLPSRELPATQHCLYVSCKWAWSVAQSYYV